MALRYITKDDFDKTRELYFKWKELNSGIKEDYSRGVNLHEALTEKMCCYANNFQSSLGGGSEDAINPINGEKIQIKGSSNFNSDLTSFGPRSSFDELHFARLDQSNDELYLYKIPINDLANIKVNSSETFKEQQNAGRRPRFSIIDKYIIPMNIQPYKIVDILTGKIK